MWIVRAERIKAGREHRVPLTDAAIGIVKGLIEPGETYVFHNAYGRQLSNMTMLKALRAVRDVAPTVHGFRSSFSDWAPRDVVEACLAYAVGDAAEPAYKRSDFLESGARSSTLGWRSRLRVLPPKLSRKS